MATKTKRVRTSETKPLRGAATTTAPSPDDRPDTVHPAVRAMRLEWRKCRDLRAGTRTVQAARTAYLPQHPGEDADDYKIRSSGAEVYNGFARTITAITGLVFQRDPELGDEASEAMRARWENIDGAGTHARVFARQLFSDALTTGLGGILVDMPAVPPGLSVDDERRLNVRPYWVAVPAESVVSWRTARDGSATVLTQLVLQEVVERPAGRFGTAHVTRYRVFTRPMIDVTDERTGLSTPRVGQTVEYEVWESTDATGKQAPTRTVPPTALRGATLGIPFAPLMVGNDRDPVWGCTPPLLDLADVNLAHYRVSADRRHVMHLSCVPLLVRIGAVVGANGHAPVIRSANTMVDLSVGGDLKYAEPSGTAFEPTRQEMVALEQRMASLGLAFLQSETRAAETAEAKRIDTTAQNASIATAATALRDCLERAAQFDAAYAGENAARVTVNTEFERVQMDATMLDSLSRMEQAGQLSLETLLSLLMAGHVLPEDFDPEQEAAKILASGARDVAEPTAGVAGADVETAVAQLDDAIALHEQHMNGTAPTTGPAGEASQQLMMNQMMAAREALAGGGEGDMAKDTKKKPTKKRKPMKMPGM